MMNARNMQSGFTLISAIFLLVVMVALGAFALTLSTAQQHSSALDVMGVRAYHAARTGIEWGLFQVLQNTAAINNGGMLCSVGGSNNTVAMPAAATALTGFTVTVNCVRYNAVQEGPVQVTMYDLTSTAVITGLAVGSAAYVERQVRMTLAQ